RHTRCLSDWSSDVCSSDLLMDVLPRLGAGWVGVTQIAPDLADEEIRSLAEIGVPALRFNIFRGNIANVDDIAPLAHRLPVLLEQIGRASCRERVESSRVGV